MKKGKYNYPMEFNTCKACGCKDELATVEFNTRNPNNKRPAAVQQLLILLSDMVSGILTPTIPGLVVNVGICPKCGTMRAKLITETSVPADVLQKAVQQQMPKLPNK